MGMSEIEEFLKRAAALRAQQAQQAQQRAPQPARLVTPPTALQRSNPIASDAEVMDAEVIESDNVSGDDVAAYVDRHLNRSEFEMRAGQLAERVRSADEQFESHLHDAFEHKLGQLGAMTSRAEDSTLDAQEEEAKAKPVSPSDLVKLIRSAQGVRNAIVVSELLTRPEHRW
jgi:hypothetical protein